MCSWSPWFSARCARISMRGRAHPRVGVLERLGQALLGDVVRRRRTARASGARARAAGGRRRVVELLQARGAASRARRRPRRSVAIARDQRRMPSAISRSTGSASPGTASANCDPRVRLVLRAGEHPEPQQRDRQPQRAAARRRCRRASAARRSRRRARPAGAGTSRAARRVRSSRLGALGERGEVARVRGARGLELARLVELLEPVLADRLEHPVARCPTTCSSDLSTSDGEAVEHVGSPRDRGGGLLGRARAEHGQPAGERALVLLQQAPAPVDHGAQRAVARQRGAAAAGQQPEAVVEARGELLDGIVRSRAAASSIASGSPSRRRQISRRPSSSSAKPGEAARGAVGEQPHGGLVGPAAGSGRGSRRRSPAARGWWRRSAGPGSRPAVGRRARPTAPIRCSQLSSSRIVSRSASASSRRSRPSRGARRRARARRRRAGRARRAWRGRSRRRRSPARARPSRRRRGRGPPTRVSASPASRVLPAPPGPTSVTSRAGREQRADPLDLARRGRRSSSPARAGCCARPLGGRGVSPLRTARCAACSSGEGTAPSSSSSRVRTRS